MKNVYAIYLLNTYHRYMQCSLFHFFSFFFFKPLNERQINSTLNFCTQVNIFVDTRWLDTCWTCTTCQRLYCTAICSREGSYGINTPVLRSLLSSHRKTTIQTGRNLTYWSPLSLAHCFLGMVLSCAGPSRAIEIHVAISSPCEL